MPPKRDPIRTPGVTTRKQQGKQVGKRGSTSPETTGGRPSRNTGDASVTAASTAPPRRTTPRKNEDPTSDQLKPNNRPTASNTSTRSTSKNTTQLTIDKYLQPLTPKNVKRSPNPKSTNSTTTPKQATRTSLRTGSKPTGKMGPKLSCVSKNKHTDASDVPYGQREGAVAEPCEQTPEIGAEKPTENTAAGVHGAQKTTKRHNERSPSPSDAKRPKMPSDSEAVSDISAAEIAAKPSDEEAEVEKDAVTQAAPAKGAENGPATAERHPGAGTTDGATTEPSDVEDDKKEDSIEKTSVKDDPLGETRKEIQLADDDAAKNDEVLLPGAEKTGTEDGADEAKPEDAKEERVEEAQEAPSDEQEESGVEKVTEKVDKMDIDDKDDSRPDSPVVPGSNINPRDDNVLEQEDDTQRTETYSNDSEKSSSKGSSDESGTDDLSDSKDAAEARSQKHKQQTNMKKKSPKLPLRSKWSDIDTEAYRSHYPGKPDDPNQKANLKFYTNKIASRPDGGRIEEIYDNWWGDYQRLEMHHGYIQWLFPIREKGMNFQSQELQVHEAEGIKSDPDAKKRVLKSYEMMLDFYGMRLRNADTGKLERAQNWKDRFQHLNRSFHNYLRITRILKSLGELGYEHLKAPFVEFVLEEAYTHNTLSNCRKSCGDYWVHTIRDEDERIRLAEKAEGYAKQTAHEKQHTSKPWW